MLWDGNMAFESDYNQLEFESDYVDQNAWGW
jgi:hypothetical protein